MRYTNPRLLYLLYFTFNYPPQSLPAGCRVLFWERPRGSIGQSVGLSVRHAKWSDLLSSQEQNNPIARVGICLLSVCLIQTLSHLLDRKLVGLSSCPIVHSFVTLCAFALWKMWRIIPEWLTKLSTSAFHRLCRVLRVSWSCRSPRQSLASPPN